MDVVLVSARSGGPSPHPSHRFVAELAADLALHGHAVRWVRPQLRGEPESEVAGVTAIRAPTRRPSVRRVLARLADLPTERALSAALRASPADVVHVHGFGGAASYLTPWLADRLGVPAVVVADPVEEVLGGHPACESRTDMLVQGFASARVVCVADATAAERLRMMGVAGRHVRIGVPPPVADAWLAIYRAARRAVVG